MRTALSIIVIFVLVADTLITSRAYAQTPSTTTQAQRLEVSLFCGEAYLQNEEQCAGRVRAKLLQLHQFQPDRRVSNILGPVRHGFAVDDVARLELRFGHTPVDAMRADLAASDHVDHVRRM